MTVEIRVPAADERQRWFEVCGASFSEQAHPEDVRVDSELIALERSLAAYDGESIVGTAADFAFRLQIPGGDLPAAGVTMVGVLPSHRRRGILTALMRRELDDAAARGEPLAALWATEAPIYGRYGYGVATRNVFLDAQRDRTSFRRPDPGGRARLVDADEAERVFPEIYDRARPQGTFARSAEWWRLYKLADPEHKRHGAGPKFFAVVELDGRPEAYAIYRVKGDWADGVPASDLRLQEAMASSPEAIRALWGFIFGVDLVARVSAWHLPPDDPLFLMVTEPARLRLRMGDGLWLRLVDVEAALAARSYAAEGTLALEVADGFLSANEGLWTLETGADGASVQRGGEADVRLDVGALASAYLGGFSFAELRAAGLVEELRPGAVDRADALFRTPRAPWCPEVF